MKKIELVGFFVLICFVVWVFVGRCNDQNELTKNGTLINVRIVSWATPSKGSSNGTLFCQFSYNTKEYRLPSPTSYGWGLHSLIGKTFPAVFSEKKLMIEILITPKDFKKYNVPFPDSLKWVIDKK